MSEGKKFDSDKPDYSLVPSESLKEAIKVLSFGAKRYGRNNWKKLSGWRRRYATAAWRHLDAILRGEDRDPDSGLPHAAHVAVNGLFLTWFALRAERKKRNAAQRKWIQVTGGLHEVGVAIKEAPVDLEYGEALQRGVV